MATMRALQASSTGGWSMSKGIRSYILCCFANPSHASNEANKEQANRSDSYEAIDLPDGSVKRKVEDADASDSKPKANGEVVLTKAIVENKQLVQAEHQSYGSVTTGNKPNHDGGREESSSDEDEELIKQRLHRMTASKSNGTMKEVAQDMETALHYEPDDDLPPPPSERRRDSRVSLSTAIDDVADNRLFDVSDLHGKGVDEEPPHVSRYGTLQATVGYDHSKNSLYVTVVRACDVPAKERGGSDSSRVHVVLLSSKKTREKTKIRSGDKPEFNETFRFKISKDDVPMVAVRMRLYGCERMKRERLIGEVIVRGGAIDMVTGTTSWYNLEPRSEMTMGGASGDDTGSLSKSDSGGSASSVNSLQGGAPEILLGLAYNSSTGRMQVEVIKGSNFRVAGSSRPPDTYVKVQLLSFNGQEISRTKTSVRRGQPNPVFKESFMFQVASFQLGDVTLMVSVFNKKNMKKKDMMGWCSLGHNNSGDEEAAHWNEMKESKGQHVNRWHTLLDS